MAATRINPDSGTVTTRYHERAAALPANGTVIVQFDNIGLSGYNIAGIVSSRCTNHGLSAFMSFSAIQNASSIQTVFRNTTQYAFADAAFGIMVLYVKS